jgi:phosphoglycerate dehydrogenase-like enzyme
MTSARIHFADEQEFVDGSPNLKSLIIPWAGLLTAIRELMLQGKSALILGYGAIGQYVGKVLSAMNMRVFGYGEIQK